MFLHLAVILFTAGREGVCLPPPHRMQTPWGWVDLPPGCRPPRVRKTPPGCRPPQGWADPPDEDPLELGRPLQMQIPLDADPPGTVNKRAVRTLLESILVAIYVNITFARCIQIKTASCAENLNQFQYKNTIRPSK